MDCCSRSSDCFHLLMFFSPCPAGSEGCSPKVITCIYFLLLIDEKFQKLTTPLLNLMAIMKSGSFVILLFATEILFKFLRSLRVFGSEVNRLSSIRSSSNLQTAKKFGCKNQLRNDLKANGWKVESGRR